MIQKLENNSSEILQLLLLRIEIRVDYSNYPNFTAKDTKMNDGRLCCAYDQWDTYESKLAKRESRNIVRKPFE